MQQCLSHLGAVLDAIHGLYTVQCNVLHVFIDLYDPGSNLPPMSDESYGILFEKRSCETGSRRRYVRSCPMKSIPLSRYISHHRLYSCIHI